MKRILAFSLSLILLCSILCCQARAEGESWYFKKKGNEPPSCGVSEQFLKDTNSVWIDPSLKDKKVIYLTFDVGYVNDNVIAILDILSILELFISFPNILEPSAESSFQLRVPLFISKDN